MEDFQRSVKVYGFGPAAAAYLNSLPEEFLARFNFWNWFAIAKSAPRGSATRERALIEMQGKEKEYRFQFGRWLKVYNDAHPEREIQELALAKMIETASFDNDWIEVNRRTPSEGKIREIVDDKMFRRQVKHSLDRGKLRSEGKLADDED